MNIFIKFRFIAISLLCATISILPQSDNTNVFAGNNNTNETAQNNSSLQQKNILIQTVLHDPTITHNERFKAYKQYILLCSPDWYVVKKEQIQPLNYNQIMMDVSLHWHGNDYYTDKQKHKAMNMYCRHNQLEQLKKDLETKRNEYLYNLNNNIDNPQLYMDLYEKTVFIDHLDKTTQQDINNFVPWFNAERIKRLPSYCTRMLWNTHLLNLRKLAELANQETFLKSHSNQKNSQYMPVKNAVKPSRKKSHQRYNDIPHEAPINLVQNHVVATETIAPTTEVINTAPKNTVNFNTPQPVEHVIKSKKSISKELLEQQKNLRALAFKKANNKQQMPTSRKQQVPPNSFDVKDNQELHQEQIAQKIIVVEEIPTHNSLILCEESTLQVKGKNYRTNQRQKSKTIQLQKELAERNFMAKEEIATRNYILKSNQQAREIGIQKTINRILKTYTEIISQDIKNDEYEYNKQIHTLRSTCDHLGSFQKKLRNINKKMSTYLILEPDLYEKIKKIDLDLQKRIDDYASITSEKNSLTLKLNQATDESQRALEDIKQAMKLQSDDKLSIIAEKKKIYNDLLSKIKNLNFSIQNLNTSSSIENCDPYYKRMNTFHNYIKRMQRKDGILNIEPIIAGVDLSATSLNPGQLQDFLKNTKHNFYSADGVKNFLEMQATMSQQDKQNAIIPLLDELQDSIVKFLSDTDIFEENRISLAKYIMKNFKTYAPSYNCGRVDLDNFMCMYIEKIKKLNTLANTCTQAQINDIAKIQAGIIEHFYQIVL